jgi:predicted nucleotidyltransferase
MIVDTIIQQSPHLDWLKSNTIYITRYGSHCYGTNVEGSDEDFKGICLLPKAYLCGFQKRFEQAELNNPDVVIYELRKFFNLAAGANPSIIETLFTDPSDHILITDTANKLIEHRDKFLSKRVKHTFCGYAFSQLKRIRLHRRYLLDPPKQPPTRAEMGLPERTLIPQDQLQAAEAVIKKELDKLNFDFIGELEESMKILIRSSIAEMLAEMKITADDQWVACARKVGLDDNFIAIAQKEREYIARKREWDQYQDWKKNRNPKRAEMEAKYGYDCKHAMHLVRLTRMAREILTIGKVIVKRPDREELLAIRNGAWKYEDIIAFAEKEDKDLQIVYESSNTLPKVPDMAFLDQLCIELQEAAIKQ